jgi:hypothetical protein
MIIDYLTRKDDRKDRRTEVARQRASVTPVAGVNLAWCGSRSRERTGRRTIIA